jgi:hypothetical protein
MQLSYETNHRAAFAGMPADLKRLDVVSSTNEDTAAIGYGLGVTQGSSDETCALPTSTSDALLGVLVHNQMSRGGVRPKGTADVLRQGRIYVAPEQEVSPSDSVFWRVTSDAPESIGRFRRDDDGGKAIEIPNARWATSGHADKPAVLELNLP